jgi:hypothetical protein
MGGRSRGWEKEKLHENAQCPWNQREVKRVRCELTCPGREMLLDPLTTTVYRMWSVLFRGIEIASKVTRYIHWRQEKKAIIDTAHVPPVANLFYSRHVAKFYFPAPRWNRRTLQCFTSVSLVSADEGFFFSWGGTYVTRYYGHFWPIVLPQMINEGDCGAIGGMKVGRGNRSTRRKPAPAPFCPTQIPLDQNPAGSRKFSTFC